MDINTLIQAVKEQVGLGVNSADKNLRASLLGQLYVADWKNLLAAAGRLYRVQVGTFSAGADIAPVTGGGGVTTIDLDRPELVVGVDTGYRLIPVDIDISVQLDMDADAEEASIIVIADVTQGPVASVTGNITTPLNLLDGGAAFPGRAFDAITADITDPVDSHILAFETIQASAFVSNGSSTNQHNGLLAQLSLRKEFHYPQYLEGPCQIVALYGGTAAVGGIGSLVFGVVPTAWFPLS